MRVNPFKSEPFKSGGKALGTSICTCIYTHWRFSLPTSTTGEDVRTEVVKWRDCSVCETRWRRSFGDAWKPACCTFVVVQWVVWFPPRVSSAAYAIASLPCCSTLNNIELLLFWRRTLLQKFMWSDDSSSAHQKALKLVPTSPDHIWPRDLSRHRNWSTIPFLRLQRKPCL